MGITIHYNGKLDNPHALDELLIAAKSFCHGHQWKYHEIDDRVLGKVERWIPSDDEEVHTETARIDDRQRGLLILNPKRCGSRLIKRASCAFTCPNQNRGIIGKTNSSPPKRNLRQ